MLFRRHFTVAHRSKESKTSFGTEKRRNRCWIHLHAMMHEHRVKDMQQKVHFNTSKRVLVRRIANLEDVFVITIGPETWRNFKILSRPCNRICTTNYILQNWLALGILRMKLIWEISIAVELFSNSRFKLCVSGTSVWDQIFVGSLVRVETFGIRSGLRMRQPCLNFRESAYILCFHKASW